MVTGQDRKFVWLPGDVEITYPDGYDPKTGEAIDDETEEDEGS